MITEDLVDMPNVSRAGDANDLIDVFRTIDPRLYDGIFGSSCLIGYPVFYGQLRNEFEAYKAAVPEVVDEVWWLSKRFGVDENLLSKLYLAVADYTSIDRNLDSAIEFAEQLLVEGRPFEQIVNDMGLERKW